MKYRIFVSSVQSEFARERKDLASYIRNDAILGKFFDVFLFEEVPAQERSTTAVYLSEVDKCDVYLCILGKTYGNTAAVPTKFELPRDVVFEGIVNAICHRDYTMNASVQVMLFRDRLEIWSPGGLPNGMTIAKLGRLHRSIPTNPLLAQAMYLRGYIDKVGSGTRDMVTKSRAWGNEAPVWKIEDGDDFRVVLPRPDIGGVRAASGTTSYTTRKTSRKTSRYTSSKTSRYTGHIAPLRSDLEAACEGLTGNARKIMQVISEDPGITIESLATLVKLTSYGIRYHLAELAKSVGLHHSSDRKGGVWEVTGSKNRPQETTPEVSPQTTLETTPQTTPQTIVGDSLGDLSKMESEIVLAIRSNPKIARTTIASNLGITLDGVKYHLKVLRVKLGLHHEGPTKKGRWVFGPKPKGNRHEQ